MNAKIVFLFISIPVELYKIVRYGKKVRPELYFYSDLHID